MFFAGNVSHTRDTPFSAKHLVLTGKPLTSVAGNLGYVTSEVLNHDARQACRSLVDRVGLLALLANHSWYAGLLIFVLWVLLGGYTPFRSDDMKEVIDDRGEVEPPCQMVKNVPDEGTPGIDRSLWECAHLTFASLIIAKSFIRALLHPNTARRLTTEQTLSHSWRTSFAAPS